MLQTALIFPFNAQGQILLWLKKRGFGKGKRTGSGGKLHEGETPIQGALRELEEETGAKLCEQDVTYRGFVQFYFVDSGEENNMDCSIFTAKYDGQVRESDEMLPKRFALEGIPFDKMRPDNKVRLTEMLSTSEGFAYEFFFTSPDDTAPKWRPIE